MLARICTCSVYGECWVNEGIPDRMHTKCVSRYTCTKLNEEVRHLLNLNLYKSFSNKL